MNFTPQTHLDATTRTVSHHEREGSPVAAITLSRLFDTTYRRPLGRRHKPRPSPWLSSPTSPATSRLNGRYHVQDNASGTITECEPQSHVALTWEFAGDTSWVELRFANEGTRTNAPDPLPYLHSVGFLGHLRPRRHRSWMGDGLPRTRPIHIRSQLQKTLNLKNSPSPPKASPSSPAAATHGQKPPSTPAPTPKKPKPPQTKQPPSIQGNHHSNRPPSERKGRERAKRGRRGMPIHHSSYPRLPTSYPCHFRHSGESRNPEGRGFIHRRHRPPRRGRLSRFQTCPYLGYRSSDPGNSGNAACGGL